MNFNYFILRGSEHFCLKNQNTRNRIRVYSKSGSNYFLCSLVCSCVCVTTIQKSFDVEIVYKSEEEKTSKMDPLVLRTKTTKSQIISYKRVQSAPFQKLARIRVA